MVIETGRLTAPITTVLPADVAMSSDGSRLYVAGDDGKLRVYDMASRTLIATWDVGVSLGAMDLSPDGSFLLVAERQEVSNNGQSSWDREAVVTVYKVDVASGAVTGFPVEVFAHDGPFYDVAILSDGSALLTASMVGAVGSAPLLWTLDLATGTYTHLQSPFLQQDSMLWASPSGSYALVAPQNMSNGPLFLYEPGVGVTQQSNLYDDNDLQTVLSVQAISVEGGFVVQSSGRLLVRDLGLDLQVVLSDLHPQFAGYQITGLAFDSSGSNLFILDQVSDTITQVSTADWSIVRTFAVGREVSNPAEFVADGDFGNQLLISPDGRYFTVVTGTGIQLVENDGLANDFTGTSAADSIDGGAGNDVLRGAEGGDIVAGGTGDDLLFGNGGDDRLVGGEGKDTYEGGDGIDTIDFSGESGPVSVNLNSGMFLFPTGSFATRSLGPNEALDSYGNFEAMQGIENLILTAGNDRVLAGDGANRIAAGAGHDRIIALGGNDVILAGAGDDTVYGGDGNDVIYFGAELSAADVADGGAGRDAIVLQGNVTAVLTDANLVGIESISIQSGANANFGDTANNLYDSDIATADGNVAAGVQLIVNAQSLRAGEDFTFDGSAETNGRFLVYGGHGVDDLTGGAGNDLFFFEGQRWGPDDRVDGGAGRDALVIAGVGGLNSIEFAADAFTAIESISLNNLLASDPSQKPSYNLVLDNGNVAPGGTLIVNGSSISLGQVVNIDGTDVVDGNLILIGGGGHDVIRGGAGTDLIVGGGGQDSLAGRAGADIFRYDSVSDSPAGAPDLIGDFQAGLDKIDLSRSDADTGTAGDQAFTWIGSNAFSGSAGELRILEDNGRQRIEGDTNGDGTADFAIVFQLGTAPLAQGDFLF